MRSGRLLEILAFTLIFSRNAAFYPIRLFLSYRNHGIIQRTGSKFLEVRSRSDILLGARTLTSRSHPASEFYLTVEDMLISQGFAWETAADVRVGGLTLTDRKELLPVREGLKFQTCGSTHDFHETVYLALCKPSGYECSRAPQSGIPSVLDLLPEHLRRRGVQCAGRLDVNTTGLLLFSDDGRFLHHLTNPEREGKLLMYYRAECASDITDNQLNRLGEGVTLTNPDGSLESKVKRMVRAAGNSVRTLHRSQVGNLTLPDDLRHGQWRLLSDEEVASALHYDLSNAMGIRRYVSRNRTMGAVRRKYAESEPAASVASPFANNAARNVAYNVANNAAGDPANNAASDGVDNVARDGASRVADNAATDDAASRAANNVAHSAAHNVANNGASDGVDNVERNRANHIAHSVASNTASNTGRNPANTAALHVARNRANHIANNVASHAANNVAHNVARNTANNPANNAASKAASNDPPAGASKAAAIHFVIEHIAAHGPTSIPVLGNELGKRGIRFAGRLTPLLRAARWKGAPAFAVSPDNMVSLCRR